MHKPVHVASCKQMHPLLQASIQGLGANGPDYGQMVVDATWAAGRLGLGAARGLITTCDHVPLVSQSINILKCICETANEIRAAEHVLECTNNSVRCITETLRSRLPLVANVAAGKMRHDSEELNAALQHALVGAFAAAEEARNLVFVWCSQSKDKQSRSAPMLDDKLRGVHARLRHRLEDITAHQVRVHSGCNAMHKLAYIRVCQHAACRLPSVCSLYADVCALRATSCGTLQPCSALANSLMRIMHPVVPTCRTHPKLQFQVHMQANELHQLVLETGEGLKLQAALATLQCSAAAALAGVTKERMRQMALSLTARAQASGERVDVCVWGRTRAIAWSPNSSLLAIRNGKTLRILDAAPGSITKRGTALAEYAFEGADEPGVLDWDATGKLLAASVGCTVTIFTIKVNAGARSFLNRLSVLPQRHC